MLEAKFSINIFKCISNVAGLRRRNTLLSSFSLQVHHLQLIHHNISRFLSTNSKLFNKITCSLIPGDGHGVDIANSIQDIFFAAHVPVNFETILLSEDSGHNKIPWDQGAKRILKNRVCLKGNLGGHQDYQNINFQLNQTLRLYGKIVHTKSVPFIKSRHDKIDLLLCTEQLYGYNSVTEFDILGNIVICSKIVMRSTYENLVEDVVLYARNNHRKEITFVHKGNILKLTDGLFIKTYEKLSSGSLKIEEIIVDNACQKLVMSPNNFDVIVLPNTYDSILTNLAAGLVGGPQFMTAVTFSKECKIFEPVCIVFVLLINIWLSSFCF